MVSSHAAGPRSSPRAGAAARARSPSRTMSGRADRSWVQSALQRGPEGSSGPASGPLIRCRPRARPGARRSRLTPRTHEQPVCSPDRLRSSPSPCRDMRTLIVRSRSTWKYQPGDRSRSATFRIRVSTSRSETATLQKVNSPRDPSCSSRRFDLPVTSTTVPDSRGRCPKTPGSARLLHCTPATPMNPCHPCAPRLCGSLSASARHRRSCRIVPVRRWTCAPRRRRRGAPRRCFRAQLVAAR